MATYISNGSGDWTTIPWLTAATLTGPTAPAAGSPPSFGLDKIVIRRPNVVTYNTSGVFGDGGNGNATGTTNPTINTASIILSGGTLRASRTVNTALTAIGCVWISAESANLNGSNSFLDWGTLSDPVSAVTASISLSSHFSAGIYPSGNTTATTVSNSACFCGLEKTRNTFLTLSAAANDNTITVDNVFNWAIGDQLVIESDTLATSRALSSVRITGFSGVDNKTITISPTLNFARLSGTRVGNFTSTVLIETVPSSTLCNGVWLRGLPNGIYQFSNITLKDFGNWWRDPSTNNTIGQTFGAIHYVALYNKVNPIFKGIAYLQTRNASQLYSSIYSQDPSLEPLNISNIAHYSVTSTANNIGVRIGANAIVNLDDYVCYRANNALTTGVPYKLNVTNSYLNSELINIGNVSGQFSSIVKGRIINSKIKSNAGLVLLDNLIDLELINCDISISPSVAIADTLNNAFGSTTIRDCTLSVPLSTSITSTTNRTIKDCDVNVYNPNNSNVFVNFNTFHYLEANSSVRKNGIRSLSFTPKIANERFEKMFSIPAVQGVTQKIKGNLRFDSNYGTATPPTILFSGAVSNTTFTCPSVDNTWHSFEYDLIPNSTGNIEIKISGQSSNTNGKVYLDGLFLDPFNTNIRWYGFEIDKNNFRTVDTLTTLTENQVSAYPYINNLDLVYDEARYWTVTNPTLSSYIDLVNSLGKSLDFSPKGILLNSTALSSISYNPTTNLITLSTFNLSAGNNFDEIQTTGGITIDDNSNIFNITLVGSVSGTTARDLNHVIIDGTLTYNTNADTIVTYTNSNIGTVENNGSGIVTINRLNSNVDYAGRNVVLLDNPTYINLTLNGGYIAIFDNTTTLRYYRNTDGQILLPNGSTGQWSYKIGRYQSKVISGTFSVGGTVNISPTYSQDLNVDTTVTVASAYTEFRNTQQVYDYFSYYMTTSAALSYPDFYNYRPILDITDKDLILDPSAALPFYYNGTVFTIKSQNLENGSIVKGVETTGNLYLFGSASLSAINIISNKINSDTVFDLKLVNAATSNIVYNTDSASSIVYTNCTVDKVENIGSGDITIKKLNSTITDGTDARILDYYPTFLNLSLNAGTIAIYDDAQTRQYFTSTNQTIELPYEADGQWTYRVTRYGQRTVEGNFTVNRVIGNTFDITPTFQPDINILNTANSVSAYSTFTSIQSIYDYMSYYKTTTTGIDYGDLTNTGSILDIGSRSLILDISSPLLLSVTSNSITLSTNSLSAGDGSIVNSLKTTNNVFLSGNSTLKNMSVQGSINQEIISNFYGMTVDGTIRYYVNTPTSITYTNCNVNNVINDGNALVTITRINSIITNENDAEVETVVPISINITVDNDTWVAIYRPNGTRYYYGSGNTTLILGGDAVTGNWSYKAAKYGHVLFTANFPINKDISSVTNINPTLVIDSSITETNVTTVTAYTSLNSNRKIYDYLSYYKTTDDGIIHGEMATRSIGAIIFTKALTLDANAASMVNVSSNVLTLRTSILDEELTVYSTGDFILLNAATISDIVKIRATNLDSELILIGITKLTLYPSSGERDSDTNKGPEITDAVYRFKYGSTVINVALSGLQYSRVDLGNTLLYNFELNTGANELNLGTFGQIQQVLNNQIVINEGVKKASRLIPHSSNL